MQVCRPFRRLALFARLAQAQIQTWMSKNSVLEAGGYAHQDWTYISICPAVNGRELTPLSVFWLTHTFFTSG